MTQYWIRSLSLWLSSEYGVFLYDSVFNTESCIMTQYQVKYRSRCKHIRNCFKALEDSTLSLVAWPSEISFRSPWSMTSDNFCNWVAVERSSVTFLFNGSVSTIFTLLFFDSGMIFTCLFKKVRDTKLDKVTLEGAENPNFQSLGIFSVTRRYRSDVR